MEQQYNELSLEQKYAFEKFRQGENLFITGPGGTGKSRLIQYMREWATMHSLQLSVCAMTGCAAVILNCGARTIHSWSGIRLAKGEIAHIVANVMRNRTACKMWRSTSILILDEVSMLSARIFELLNILGKKIRKSPRPFGGMQVVFTGDFYQLPPVGGDADPRDSQFCFQSPEWKHVFSPQNWIELTTMFRQTDPKYIEILQQIRVGKLSEENAEYLTQYIKRPYNPEEYGGLIPTKLYALRNVVDGVNQRMFRELDKEEYEYEIIMKTDCLQYLDGSDAPITVADLERGRELAQHPAEMETELQLLKNQTQTPDKLSLKEGSVVMCTSNIALDIGICNGSQGIIVGFGPGTDKHGYAEIPIVQFTNGVKMKIPIQYRHSSEYPTVAVGQIPLCLAWALTIHKIQGATISMAQMDIGKTIFEYGQTYVALSRIKSLNGLYLSSFMPQKIRAHPDVVAFYSTFPKVDEQPMLQYIASHKYRGLPHTTTLHLAPLPITSGVRVIRTDTNGVSLPPTSSLTSNPFQTYAMPRLPATITKTQVRRISDTMSTSFTPSSPPPIRPSTPPSPTSSTSTPALLPPLPPVVNNAVEVVTEVVTDDKSLQCCICITAPKCVMLLPCKHVCLCEECAKNVELINKNCPICRKRFSKTMRLFL